VQTCALPILSASPIEPAPRLRLIRNKPAHVVLMAFIWSRLAPFFNPRVSRTAVQGRSRKCGGEPIMDPRQRLTQSETLSAALRLIRSHRRLKASEVADRMNMAQR